jgi:ATP-binding protein involved in chromosome partitioning
MLMPKKLPNVKQVIAVSSAKGGVGKSTVAANLAMALQLEGYRVGVLDADLYGPSQPLIFGVSEQRPDVDANGKMSPIMAHGLALMSIGFHLQREDSALIWRGAQLNSALEKLLFDTNWPTLDYLVVDLPPGTGDIQLSLSQQVAVAGALVVSTPQELALLDAKKGLKMLHQLNIPVLGVVENMNMFICPQCGHEEHLFGHDAAQLMSLQYLVNFLGSLPLDKRIQQGDESGVPFVLAHPDDKISGIFREMARKVVAIVDQNTRDASPVVPQTAEQLQPQIREIKWNI